MPDPSELARIPVSPGFTWTTAFTALGSFSTIGLIGLIIRHIGPWRKQRDDAEESLRVALTKRVEKLETDREHERTKHEAERALDRHKIRNLVQCLDAILIVLETSPEKAAEVVPKIRAMREAQMLAEAQEAAQIRAAELIVKSQGVL